MVPQVMLQNYSFIWRLLSGHVNETRVKFNFHKIMLGKTESIINFQYYKNINRNKSKVFQLFLNIEHIFTKVEKYKAVPWLLHIL